MVWCSAMLQRHKGAKVQGCKGAKMQRHKATITKEYKGARCGVELLNYGE